MFQVKFRYHIRCFTSLLIALLIVLSQIDFNKGLRVCLLIKRKFFPFKLLASAGSMACMVKGQVRRASLCCFNKFHRIHPTRLSRKNISNKTLIAD